MEEMYKVQVQVEVRFSGTGVETPRNCHEDSSAAYAGRDTRYRGSLFGHAGVSYWSTDSIGILIGYLKRVGRVSLFRVISRRYDLLT